MLAKQSRTTVFLETVPPHWLDILYMRLYYFKHIKKKKLYQWHTAHWITQALEDIFFIFFRCFHCRIFNWYLATIWSQHAILSSSCEQRLQQLLTSQVSSSILILHMKTITSDILNVMTRNWGGQCIYLKFYSFDNQVQNKGNIWGNGDTWGKDKNRISEKNSVEICCECQMSSLILKCFSLS